MSSGGFSKFSMWGGEITNVNEVSFARVRRAKGSTSPRRIRRIAGPQADSSSGFHDLLTLKAARFEACYIQHSFCCIHLHCIFSTHKSCWAAPQVFAKPSQYLLCSKNPNSSRQWSSAWPKHSDTSWSCTLGKSLSFRSLKIICWWRAHQHEQKTWSKSTAEHLVSQQEDKESIWLISITLSLKQPHRNRAGHEFSVRRIVQAHQILKSTADVCSPF